MVNHTDWLSIYRLATRNTGDKVCSPAQYFHLPPSQKIDILNSDYAASTKNYLIGGGGILYFGDRISKLIERCEKKIVIWGAGHNLHKRVAIDYPTALEKCDLVGLRDWNSPYEWVPCASCMSPLFDETYEAKREVGFYSHYAIKNTHIQGMTNDQPFSEVIKYLGESEVVVTNSYHGVYWATLLGRKVIAYSHSTKFKTLRHMPVLIEDSRSWQHYLTKCREYPESLEQCRKANKQFYAQFLTLFG